MVPKSIRNDFIQIVMFIIIIDVYFITFFHMKIEIKLYENVFLKDKSVIFFFTLSKKISPMNWSKFLIG